MCVLLSLMSLLNKTEITVVPLVFFSSSPKDRPIDLREREKPQCERETTISCFPYMHSDQGLNLQLRFVSQPGMGLTTLGGMR